MKEMSKAQARAFIRKIMGPPRRIIKGQEKEHLLTVLELIEPSTDSNNQRTWTSVYRHAGKEYHHTTGDEFDELTEILPDDDEES